MQPFPFSILQQIYLEEGQEKCVEASVDSTSVVSFFNDVIEGGSISMTGVRIG